MSNCFGTSCYVSIFLDNLKTIRNKDWDKVKEAFIIPENPLELEKMEIQSPGKKKKTVRFDTTKGVQCNLFSLGMEQNKETVI